MGTITESTADSSSATGAWARRVATWLGAVLAIGSAVGLLLALLGYGVALSVQNTFGLPHASLFGSSLDLFSLGSWAIAQGVPSLTTLAFYTQTWARMWPLVRDAWIYVSVLFVLGSVGLLLRAKALSVVRYLRDRNAKGRFRHFLRERPGLQNAVIIVLSWALTLVSIPAGLAIGILAIGVACVAVALVPIAGLYAGEAHIKDWVIRPTACLSTKTRVERLTQPSSNPSPSTKIYVADCVAVMRADGKTEKGRLVFAASGAVVLYDPQAATVRRVPTDGAVIEAIGDL